MKRIRLTQGKYALVDDEDYERVIAHKWRAHKSGKTWYAETGSGKDMVLMHRFILGTEEDRETDHRDGNGLHNWSDNLREATRTQNNRNRPGWAKHGFKGVARVTNTDRWAARVQVDKCMIALGCFDTPEDAARAYDAGALIHHGAFARLNFPQAQYA